MTYATPQITHLKHGGVGDWTEARDVAGLDWEPQLEMLQTPLGFIATDVQAVVNSKTLKYISSVSTRFGLIDHNLVGRVVETVQRVHGGANITAIVLLNGGRRIGVRITHGSLVLPFDSSPIEMETWVWLRHDAKGSLYTVENAQRMGCTNQLGFFGPGMATDMKVHHTGDVESKILELVTRYTERADWAAWEKEMTTLAETQVSDNVVNFFVDEWIPLPEDPEVSPVRAESARATVRSLWTSYSRDLGPNLYSAYQAITEYEDQHRTARGEAGLFNRAIQPNRRKTDALGALRTLVTV